MRSAHFVTALFGAVAQAQWLVHVDYSRCSTPTELEPVLDGLNATKIGSNIYEFANITAPYSGALALKPAGSIGLGSPYPVDQVYVELFETADVNGTWGVATFEPATEVLRTALVAWYTEPNKNIFSKAKIDYTTLGKEETASVGVTVNESRLWVYYCSYPTAA